jgi:hypothetical protein
MALKTTAGSAQEAEMLPIPDLNYAPGETLETVLRGARIADPVISGPDTRNMPLCRKVSH